MSKTYQNDPSASFDIDPLIALLIPKPRMSLIEKLDHNSNGAHDKGCCLKFDNACCSMLGRWWNVRYKWQRKVIDFVEKPVFHVVIILLVLIDCLLVIGELLLDFIKLNKSCESKPSNHSTAHDKHNEHHQIELLIEILHYSSLVLLAGFLLEVLIKVFAFGRRWWNLHDKKMEWLDAIIVIVSFAVDLAIMYKTNLFAEIALLFISLRLWRFIRIINSIAQTIQSEGENKKKHLGTTYHAAIEAFLVISEKKTAALSEFGRDMTPENFHNVLEKFESIDQTCRVVVEQNPEPSSVHAVTEISHKLQRVIYEFQPTSLTVDLSSNENVDN